MSAADDHICATAAAIVAGRFTDPRERDVVRSRIESAIRDAVQRVAEPMRLGLRSADGLLRYFSAHWPEIAVLPSVIGTRLDVARALAVADLVLA